MKKDELKVPENENLTDEEIKKRELQRQRANKKKRKKMIKSAIVIAIVALIAVFAFSRYLAIKNAEKQAEMLTTYTVSRRDIQQVLSGTGTLMPADSYTVSASVRGDILSAPFEEGDEVKEGDLLYVIDSSEMSNTLRQREMSVENALDNYNELVSDRNKLKTYSEYSGIITELYVDAGDTVREDQVIADIVDKDKVLIDLPFFEMDVANMSIGDAVTLTVSGTGETLYGEIVEIAGISGVSATGAKTKSVTVRANNPGGITKNTTASGALSLDVTSTGESSFYYNVEKQILASYGGDIKNLAVYEGQTITEGDFILEIDGKDLEKSIKNANQTLENAQLNYDNALETVGDYRITAPITGTVVEKNYNAGESIDVTSGSKTCAIIYDLSSLTFDMNIDELDIFSIVKGQEVTISSDAYSGKTFKGEITKISKVGSTSSGTTVYPVTVTINDEEALASLLPGMNIDAKIIISKSEQVLSVPTGAIARGNTVQVVRSVAVNTDTASKPAGNMGERPEMPDGMGMPDGNMGSALSMGGYGTVPGDTVLETVKVETGVSDDDYIEIVSGLSEGDVVIVQAEQNTFSVFGGMFGGMGGGMPMGNMGGGMPSGGMGGGRPSGGGMPGGR